MGVVSENDPKITLGFNSGCLTLEGISQEQSASLPMIAADERLGCWSAPAHSYRDIVTVLGSENICDDAKGYRSLALEDKNPLELRDHQKEGLERWLKAKGRGVVSLPTGAGKTILAIHAILKTQRSTLVVVPTIDLMRQWADVCHRHFDVPIGMLGGGEKRVEDLTVATYDSAALSMEARGARFGLLVVDECHHLPAPQYQMIALACLAPYRLGLSATVERADGKEELIYQFLGELVYDCKIKDLESSVLAPYEVQTVEVDLKPDELEKYQDARRVYTDFLKRFRINLGSSGGWREFLTKSSYLPGGKAAIHGYRAQKTIAQRARAKVEMLWDILARHRGERVLVFTESNDFAYAIGEELLLPVLTHHTKPGERKRFLSAFRNGELSVLVTSKVLNEGVDVPEASVAVIMAGSGAVREHVQRLGRILRQSQGKRATMYELVARDTSEQFVNQRRRRHDAYKKPSQV